MTESRYHSAVDHAGLRYLREEIRVVRKEVLNHPIYESILTTDDVATFMETHVFAVWDFMSLLKKLQQQLTGIEVPWTPTGPTVSRRLINEIVLVEESDEFGGGYTSHFELYLSAMAAIGADTAPLESLLAGLERGEPAVPALAAAGAPAAAVAFSRVTFDIIENAPLHCQAACFAFGREDLIPEMFDQVVGMARKDPRLELFVDYLTRHIQVDDEEHTPMAMHMLVELCGDDDARWRECADSLTTALRARLALWEGISGRLTRS